MTLETPPDTSHSTARTPRLPKGQRLTEGWPVLSYGSNPRIDLATWEFRVFGLVEQEVRLSWEQLQALPQVRSRSDMHCVTTWSKYDNDWEGVRISDVLALAKPLPAAKHVMFHSYGGYTTNVPLDELQYDAALLAHTHNGEPIAPDHGGPLRGVIPHLYFWKSAKWVRGMELIADERPGFWEMYGYHIHGDPWTEERYS
ncbi:MAG: sulfite oxidase-like oxidoreductase [Chloroflexi bacterium]|nr:sulfite oxidase-like oxidoreductase [Chloroflexota bacterium]